ncbi:hypothetical protein [Streptomyces sp. B6B3]
MVVGLASVGYLLMLAAAFSGTLEERSEGKLSDTVSGTAVRGGTVW